MAEGTFFAPAERAEPGDLEEQIRFVGESPLVSGLLNTVCGLLAVLNGSRQIVSLNDSFMKLLGIDDPASVLGSRPGEALHCVHCNDEPGGCGTTRFCSTCGAALAIVAALGETGPAERLCALTTTQNGKEADFAFLVKARPIRIREELFVMIFLQDVSFSQRMAALERTFFHDVNNMLTLLLQAGELLEAEHPSYLASIMRNTAFRLAREVDIQRCISAENRSEYTPVKEPVVLKEFLDEIELFFREHPAVAGKTLVFEKPLPTHSVFTDPSLLSRILMNMIINALEASGKGDTVTVSGVHHRGKTSFSVHNPSVIPPDVADRVFQRNFSTKNDPGRGFGTWSMKLFGEKILQGSVGFTSTPGVGTVFTLTLPEEP